MARKWSSSTNVSAGNTWSRESTLVTLLFGGGTICRLINRCGLDDSAMQVTEVVRGKDLLLSTFRQLLIYRAAESLATYILPRTVNPG
jgi:hypothetical protein